MFTDCLELALLAGYSARTEKLGLLQKLSTKLDALKFFLKLLWELKSINNAKYSSLSIPMSEIGKMVGGWLKQISKESPRV